MAKPELQHLDTDKRPTRVPVNGPRNLMEIPNRDPNFHYTWQYDDAGQLERFINAGYEFVDAASHGRVGDPQVDKPSRLPGMGTALTLQYGPKTLYALRQKMEWWNEDFEREQLEIESKERQAATPTHEGGYGGVKATGGKAPEIHFGSRRK